MITIINEMTTQQQIQLVKNSSTTTEELWKLAAQENLPPEVKEDLLKKNDWIINKLLNSSSAKIDSHSGSDLAYCADDTIEPSSLSGAGEAESLADQDFYAQQHFGDRYKLAGNKNLFPSVIEFLAKDPHKSVIMNLLRNKHISIPSHVQLFMLEKDDLDIKIWMARRRDVCLEVQRLISSSKSYDGSVRELASNPNISHEAQMNLIIDVGRFGDSEKKVKIALADNTNLKLDAQASLIGEEDIVKARLAQNPSILPTLQRCLVKSKSDIVLACLAENDNLVIEVQRILTQEPSSHVRQQLAKNKFLAEDVQLSLAEDVKRHVRLTLAKNKNLCSTARFVLSKDEDEKVRYLAKKSPASTYSK